MNPTDVARYELMGKFYLGRESVDGAANGEPLLYDSRDLLTHGVVLGMTGSGKTGLCLAMLEEAAMDGVPSIVIDPKGDIANLMLSFPDLRPADFEPWIQEEEAARKGISRGEVAAKTAEVWEKGLAEWGQGKDRIRSFHDKVDVNLFTPGSQSGIPVSILASLEPPPPEVREDRELWNEHVVNTVTSLLAMVGLGEGAEDSPEAVLVSSIFQEAWGKGQTLDFESLIRSIQNPPFDKIGVLDLDSFLDAGDRMELALKFNRVLASPGFATWCEGVPLDIARMLYDPQGKPRISVFSIAHLNDEDRMFFTSLLLNQMLGWMRKQSGTTSLRALFYMDEIFGYLPPSANPPSKRPLMILLKQARAFGLGCLLATQNPVDLDYKALSNIGTWFLGRLQTERDKLRVLDGLQGAVGAGGKAFHRADLEKLLSGLGSRVFLMNNVHEDAPVLFHVRWVMSYLAGPLTRSQIKLLMDPKRSAWTTAPDPTPAAANPMSRSLPAKVSQRPIVGVGVVEKFIEADGAAEELTYHPYLLRKGTVYFRSTTFAIDGAREVVTAHPVSADGIDWEDPLAGLPASFADRSMDGVGFSDLPGFAMNQDNYREVKKEFADQLYHNERVEMLTCPLLKESAAWGESEGDFRARLAQRSREMRDDRIEELRSAADKKLATLQDRLRTAEAQFTRQEAEANSAKMQAGVSIVGSLLKGLLGRKTATSTISGASSAVGRASSAYKQQQDVTAAKDKVKSVLEKIADLERETADALEEVRAAYAPDRLPLETETLKPTRAGVKVDEVALLWVPQTARGEAGWRRS